MRRSVCCCLAALLALASTSTACAGERLLTLGSAVTEMIYALGDGDALVGVDASSTWPPAARALPQVGYHRALGAEGLLALRPTQVLGTRDAGPPQALAPLREAGVDLRLFEPATTLDGALDLLLAVARARGKEARGVAICAGIRAQLAALAPAGGARSVVLMAGRGAMLVAGRDTAADLVLQLAGARNAVSAFAGYRPLGAESLAALAPEAIVVPSHALEALGGREALLAAPGLARTPAGRAGRLVVLDSALLLGLGPRLGEAARSLAAALRESARSTAAVH